MRGRIGEIKKTHPKGTRVELVFMDDEFAPPAGTKGTVSRVDDMGTAHISWGNGSCLGSVP